MRRLSATLCLLPVLALFLAAGCATKVEPLVYLPEEPRSKIAAGKTLVLVPPFDGRPMEERKPSGEKVGAVAYFTDMLEKECDASGLKWERAAFACTPDFAGVADALKASPAPEGTVVMAASLAWMSGEFVFSCDVKLYSNTGTVLFEKRGLCMMLGLVGNPENMKHMREMFYSGKPMTDAERDQLRRSAQRMAMRQIFSDPAFIRALE